MGLAGRIRQLERDVRAHFNVDPTVPGNERRARIYNRYFDHAILRGIWTNEREIAPGVFRSNHPTHERFAQMPARGIHTVLNLRGASVSAHYMTEKASCEALGLTLVNATLHARTAASRAEIQHLIAVFRKIEKPFVMHCKSGADRAGFASAIVPSGAMMTTPSVIRRKSAPSIEPSSVMNSSATSSQPTCRCR
jgi:protein tyrosine phosphatase (PTP) superfamily phosphohydrolase (DUF442 family)